MVFSAIRNWFSQYTSFKKEEIQIDTQLLNNDDIGSEKIEPKLNLTPANNSYFQRYVIAAVPISDMEKTLRDRKSEDRNKTLLRAAIRINRHIESRAESFPSSESARDYLISLIQYMTDTVQIVRFVLNGDDAAYTIFETLNDRGLELAPLDLVKNYLFSRADRPGAGRLTDLEERWSEMMTLLGSVRVDSFLRAFWASRHGVMEGTKLFGSFKRTYDTPPKTLSVSVDMRSAAEKYYALSNSEDAIWSTYSEDAKKSVDALNIIGSTQMHPILLAALERFDKAQMERLLRLLEVIAVRYQLVNRGRPGRIESLGGRAARDIWERKITSATEVSSMLRELYIADADFKQRFKTKNETDGKKARYLLAVIEKQSLLREGKTFKDELVPGSVTLEHILPKSPQLHWKEEIELDPKLIEDMLHRLGNMCLLPEVNRALGNRSWGDKKEQFARSRLRTTHTLTQYETWGRQQIETRQEYMADLAVAAWRFQ